MARLPGGAWLLGWTDPLHLANTLLRRALQQRAHYARGRLLDIGCGSQPYRELFPQVERYLALDLPPHGGLDLIGDALKLPFRNQVVETVLCNEVLEHVPEPATLMAEVARVLRPGGHLLLTTPQTWGAHAEPRDFYRYTTYGLCYLAERHGLQVLEVAPTCGVWATVAQRLVDTVIHVYIPAKPARLRIVLAHLLAPVLLTGFLLDRLCGPRGDPLDHLLVARKPS